MRALCPFRIAAAICSGNKQTPQGILSYSYDAHGNLLSIGSKNPDGTARTGVSIGYEWDPMNRLKRRANNRINERRTGYDLLF